jgi:hypothetical protein
MTILLKIDGTDNKGILLIHGYFYRFFNTSDQFEGCYFLSMLILLYSSFSVSFEFQHNVCGRSIYAEGTIDAAIFLHRKVV